MRNTAQRPKTIAPDRLSRLDLNHLRTFAAVARVGSFSAASRALRVRQPAISKAIAGLEKEVGATLFERGRAETCHRTHVKPWASRRQDGCRA